MKKIYVLLLAFIATSLSFGQATDLYISMYSEGSGNNKFIEIFNGTGADVDLANYSVELYGNGSATATHTETFAANTILSSGSVFVIANSSADATITNVADITSTVTYFNGDDAVALLKNGTVIDVIGEIGIDPGSAWDVAGVSGGTKNHTLTRKSSICSPNSDWATSAGTDANDSEWIVTGIDTGWSDLGSFTGCASSPILSISSPTANEVFAPNHTDIDVTFTVQNFTVGTDGSVNWRLDGGSWNTQTNTNPITVTGLAAGSHTVDMKLVDNSGNDLNPAVEASVTFEIATYTVVHTIADLRAGTVGDYYHFDGEAFTIGGQAFQSGAVKGYAQDATGGILAYIPSGITTNQPSLYDGISNVKGKLKDYHGVLEIELTEDFTMTGNNQVQNPQVVTLSDYITNHDDYESELIQFDNVTIDAGSDTEFQSSTNYDVTDGTDTVVLRTAFSAIVGETIPTGAVNITGIGSEYNGTPQIFPRDINDIVDANAISENNIDGLEVYPNPVINKQVFVRSTSSDAKQIIIYNVLGKTVYQTEINNGQAINVGQLKAGIYMMKIIENGQVGLQKLIIK